jgi:hypothetical protein
MSSEALCVGGSFTRSMEERVGFEPTIPIPRNNGFQDRRIRPLCHLSTTNKYQRTYENNITNFFKKTSQKNKNFCHVEAKYGLPYDCVLRSFMRRRKLVRAKTGAPGRSRTCNLQIRSLTLCPIELRARKFQNIIHLNIMAMPALLRPDGLRRAYFLSLHMAVPYEALAKYGGERGIRTLVPGFPDSCLAGKRFGPLSHLSPLFQIYIKGYRQLLFFQVYL